MREHELDLIAALAEGTLEDETEARALIASSERHRAEYEAQKAAIAALSDVESAEMTEQERAALRRDLWTELRSTEAAAPEKTSWLYRWSFAAAALLVLVGLVAVLSQGGFMAADEAADSANLDTTEEAASDFLAPAESAQRTETTTAVGESDGAAGADTGLEADEMAETRGDAAVFADAAERLRSTDFLGVSAAPDASMFDAAELEDCLLLAELEGFEVVGTMTGEQISDTMTPEETFIVAVGRDGELDAGAPIAFVEAGSCAVVHIDR